MKTLIVDNVPVSLAESGRGAPLIMLHGWGTSSSSFDPVLPLDGLRTICLDLPGFGMTPISSHISHLRGYAGLIKAVADKLGLARYSVLGHSFGGRVAICLASEVDDRIEKVILVDSAGLPEISSNWRSVIGAIPLPQALKLGLRPLSKRLLGSRDLKAAGELEEIMRNVAREDLSLVATKITKPTLIIWGEKDRETPIEMAEKLHNLISGSKLQVIKNAGHFPFRDAPQEVNSLIVEFMR